jgi:acetyl esterase/lipase
MNGALNTSLIVALFALMALSPPMPQRSSPFNLQFALGYLINEQPFLGLWWLLSGTLATLIKPELGSTLWWLVVGLSTLDALVLVLIAVRARSARPVLSEAFRTAFGPDVRGPRFTRPSWWRITLLPFIAWRPDVRRIRNRRYGPARRGNRLDLYVSRRHNRAAAPVLVYLHGGAFRMGSKMLGAHPLLYRLAAQGWVCISADYRLFRARYSDQLADVRAVLTWTRAHAEAYGGSPSNVFVAGGSSGAHMAATVALSGAEVRGVIALYGYYGNAGEPGPEPTSPHAYITADAPPFLIIHGSLDTLVLASDARRFADQVRSVSRQPVAYAELPGAQHNFDFFHSLRFHSITDAIVRFAELTATGRRVDRTKGAPYHEPLPRR